MEDRKLRRFRIRGIGGIHGRVAVCCFVQFSVGTRPTRPRNRRATSAYTEIYGRMHRGKGIFHFSDMIKHANTARQISGLDARHISPVGRVHGGCAEDLYFRGGGSLSKSNWPCHIPNYLRRIGATLCGTSSAQAAQMAIMTLLQNLVRAAISTLVLLGTDPPSSVMIRTRSGGHLDPEILIISGND